MKHLCTLTVLLAMLGVAVASILIEVPIRLVYRNERDGLNSLSSWYRASSLRCRLVSVQTGGGLE